MLLTVGTGAFSITQPILEGDGFVIGDADMNGSVNARDSLVIKADIAGVPGFETPDKNAADINADGKVNSVDCFYLKASYIDKIDLNSFNNSNAVYKMLIGDTDISEFTFVLPESCDESTNVYFAYELLREYIKKATGFTVPMVKSNDIVEHGIYFHNVDPMCKMGTKLGQDGFRYSVNGGSLYIYGTYRGNMYAAYEIIEKYLGFYFCCNDYTLSEKVRCASLEEGLEREFIPPFESRYVYSSFWGSSKPWFYLARGLNSSCNGDNTNSRYYGTFIGTRYTNAHSFYFYLAMAAGVMPEEGATKADGTVMTLADRYYSKYEDGIKNAYYYGLINDPSKISETGKQPCTSSKEEFELLYTGFLETIHMLEARGYDLFFEEGIHCMSFSINDTDPTVTDGGYCDCRFCNYKVNGTTTRLNATLKNEIEDYGGKYTISEDGKNITFEKEPYSAIYLDLINRAAKRAQEDYPGISLYCILYDHSVPNYIRPASNLVITYCGNGCNQHPLGSGQCNNTGSLRYDWGYPAMAGERYTNSYDEYAIPTWAKYCHETGAKLYFWMYPETYSTLLYDFPNVMNVYYDINWLYSVGVDGVYYEGSGANADLKLTQPLKAYLAAEVQWNPAMTVDEFISIMKRYMKTYYGGGYEYIYQYIMLLEEAGNVKDKCAYAAFDLVWDMYSKDFVAEHYEKMRALILKAIEVEDNNRVRCALMNCDFLGLSACYSAMYQNGDSASRSVYEERYTEMFNYIKDNNIRIYIGDLYTMPSSISFDKDPATQFYKNTTRG